MVVEPLKAHPARFSDKIIQEIQRQVMERANFGRFDSLPIKVLDPFAGVGRIHEIAAPLVATYGMELEPEWAANHVRTYVGDSRHLPWFNNSFDFVATSPCYGNRMADHHDAKDTSKRNTYTHTIGRKLTEGNAGAMQWGDEYRHLHEAVWLEVWRVLRGDGIFLLNISDHIRNKKIVPVSQWHLDTCLGMGLKLVERVDIKTPRNRFGANAEARVEFEHIFVLEKPGA
jgi:SAM-dependent methyltransferase